MASPGGEGRNEGERYGGLAGTVIRGISIAGSGYALTQALTLLIYLVIARLVTPEEFGVYAAASVVIGIGLLFTTSGMLAALIHRRDRVEEAANTAVISTFAAGFGLSLLVFAISPLVGDLFRSDQVGDVTAAVSGLLFLRTCTIVPDALLQRRFSFLRRTIVEPIAVVAFGATAIIATSEGLGVWGLVIGHYAGGVVDAVLAWALVRWRPHLTMASIGMWRELMSYGRNVLAGGILLRAGDQADRVLVGRFIGEASLGQYAYAYRLAATPYDAMLAAASHVLFPAFARIVDDRERFAPAFLRALRWVCVMAFPIGLILIPLGEPLAVILFGEVWREAGYAAMAMCLYASANSVASIPLEAIKAEGSTHLLIRVHGFTTVLTVVIMVAVLPYGLYAIAGALSAGTAIGAVYAFREFRTVIEIPVADLMMQVWPPALAAGLMAGALYPIEHHFVQSDTHGVVVGVLLLAAEGLLGLLIFLGALWLLAPTGMKEEAASALVNVRKRLPSRR